MKKILKVFSVMALSIAMVGCAKEAEDPKYEPPKNVILEKTSDDPIQIVEAEVNTIYDFSVYEGKKAFLVVSNKSPETKTVFTPSRSANVDRNLITDEITNQYKIKSVNPPSLGIKYIKSTEESRAAIRNEAEQKEPELNDIRDFFAATELWGTSEELAKGAVLTNIGEHCYVWYVKNDNINITDEKLQLLADTFDEIYEKETYLFGSNIPTFEYSNIIDIPENTKINIIVYDIYGDYEITEANDGGGVAGYFWPLDFIKNDYLIQNEDVRKSNECECIHIDSWFLEKQPEMQRSAIAHEFQHLLHYVNKTLNSGFVVIKDGVRYNQESATWFNEMMSMVCEDIMQSHLSIDDKDSPKGRLSLFNQTFMMGFNYWRDRAHGYQDDNNVGISYANAYAFGAYLVRNYGIDFIKELATNIYIDEKAITEALSKKSIDPDVTTFEQALNQYFNVIMNPETSKYTLNKKVDKTYNDIAGNKTVTFECKAIDLSQYVTLPGKHINETNWYIDQLYNAELNTDYLGPFILKETYLYYTLDGYGMFATYLGTVSQDNYQNYLDPKFWSMDSNISYKVVFKD